MCKYKNLEKSFAKCIGESKEFYICVIFTHNSEMQIWYLFVQSDL